MSALGADAIASALEALPGWRHEGGKLLKSWTHGNFREAIAFITRVAFEAEERGHHPELFNVWSRVDIALTTHDAGNRVTDKDIELARAIEAIAPK